MTKYVFNKLFISLLYEKWDLFILLNLAGISISIYVLYVIVYKSYTMELLRFISLYLHVSTNQQNANYICPKETNCSNLNKIYVHTFTKS